MSVREERLAKNRENQRRWREANREKSRENALSSYHKNKVKYQARRAMYQREKMRDDPVYAIKAKLRIRLNQALKGQYKIGSHVEFLGCTPEELKTYLESHFTKEMNWGNYGSVWHIDHVRPLCSFDLSTEEGIKEACHYSNLFPLFSGENLRKARYDRMEIVS